MISHPRTRDFLAISAYGLAVSFFWGAILFVVLQSLVQSLVAAEIGPWVSATQREGLTTQRLGFLQGTGAFVAVATQLICAALSDVSRHRSGRRKPFLIAGTLLASVGVALLPFVTNYWQLFVLFLVLQGCVNLANAPYQALLPDLVPPQHHSTAAAYMGLMTLLGRTGGMVAGALLLRHPWGLTALCVVFLVLLNGCMLFTALFTREEPLPPETQTSGVFATLRAAFRFDLRGQSSFVWVLVCRFVVNMGVFTVIPLFLYYLMNTLNLAKNEALRQQAMIGLIVNFSGLLATFPAGKGSVRFSKKAVLYFTCALAVVGGFSFAMAGSTTQVLLAAGVFGLAYGAFVAVDWALVCNVLPPGGAAKYMGLWGLADILPQIVAPFLGSLFAAWSIAQYGPATGYRVVMLLGIFWFVVASICLRFVKERRFPSAA